MGCQGPVIANSINGLLVGIVVGVTLGVVKSLQGDKKMTDLMKELIPQCALVGTVIGFSYSMIADCTGLMAKN